MRWLAPDGTVWASRFEYGVFLGYKAAGYEVRKCGAEDSVSYQRSVRNGVCGECGSARVATAHSYTPDLSVDPKDGGQRKPVGDVGPYVVECKGYLRGDRRSLLRALRKARPDMPLRLIVQRDYPVTKSLSIVEWARKFLKLPVAVWTGEPPAWSGLK